MSLSSARGKLHESFRVLESRWIDTRHGWNDQMGRQFEKDFWEPLPPAVESALRAIDRLSTVLHQMRQECE
jgi:hypothetical protein